MCANFGDSRSRDCEMRHKKHKKTAIFSLKIYYFAYNSKTIKFAKLKFGHNVDAYKCFTQTEFGDPGLVNKIYRPKMGKKLTNLNRYISVITDIDEKGFAVFEHFINLLSFGYFCLSQFENYFFVLFLFSYFFFFLFFFSCCPL